MSTAVVARRRETRAISSGCEPLMASRWSALQLCTLDVFGRPKMALIGWSSSALGLELHLLDTMWIFTDG